MGLFSLFIEFQMAPYISLAFLKLWIHYLQLAMELMVQDYFKDSIIFLISNKDVYWTALPYAEKHKAESKIQKEKIKDSIIKLPTSTFH